MTILAPLPKFGDFQSKIGLIHKSLLCEMPHYRKLTENHNVMNTTLARHFSLHGS